MADEGVVVAMLTVNGKACGMQVFLVPFRDAHGKLLSGISVEDMGVKSVGYDLDNARLIFTNCAVPVSALLSRYLHVSPAGEVSVPAAAKGRKTMEFVGQRLFTGRVAVAQAALAFSEQCVSSRVCLISLIFLSALLGLTASFPPVPRRLFASTYAFASQKECWTPSGARPKLAAVPQLAALFSSGTSQIKVMQDFSQQVEARLCACLRADQIPPLALQQAIAVGKVKAVECSITLCFALKQEVGSRALMAGTGFEQLDFLQCCKFAEGDSRILMQKMARDLVRSNKGANAPEQLALAELNAALKVAESKLSKSAAWDSCWVLVYALAEAHMAGVLDSVLPNASARTPSAVIRSIGAETSTPHAKL